ncbi:MAG: hypothetical protein ACLSG7_06145 [Clostridia bacterium]
MKTCGVLLGAISKRFDTIVEFTAFENFISFEKKCKNKVERVENNKIKVTIAMLTALGLKMLTLTNYFRFSHSIATNYLLIVGLIADGIGILALKYLTPKNDYLTITIKFGIRFMGY